MSLLIFALTLSVLVFVHEFAHFLAAKWSGVDIEEFGFGLPPRLFGRKFRGTLYSVNLLPIGGFVRLKGEGGETAGIGGGGSFSSAPPKKRALIIAAGVTGNLVLSFLLLTFLFIVGYPRYLGEVLIEAVSPDSPAAASELRVGDQVLTVNGQRVETVTMLVNLTNENRGKKMALTLKRGEETVAVSAVPRPSPPSGQGPLGVRLGVRGKLVYDRSPFFLAPLAATAEIGRGVGLMVEGLAATFKMLMSRAVPIGLTGVVGIYQMTSEASGMGPRVFLQFVSILSLNLFVVNVLPIPALDGGRLLFILLERISRRKIPPRLETAANNLGFAFLLTVLLLVTILDIKRLRG